MTVILLKWISYIAIIGGIFVIFEEGEIVIGLVMIAVGVIWLYLKNKSSDSPIKLPKLNLTKSQKMNKSLARKFCTNCGEKVGTEDVFCRCCGNKLN